MPNTINPRTLLFKPRQVLLSKTNMKSNNNDPKRRTLKPEQKTSLLHSIAGYLQSNGFSKTLKKFRSEAHIENYDHREAIISLEDIFCNHLGTCDHSGKSFSGQKVEDSQMDGNSVKDKEADFAAGAEIVSKKKKKRSDKDSQATIGQSKDNTVPELNVKLKAKKKSKKTSDSQGQSEQVSTDVVAKESADSLMCDIQLQEPDKKHKDKKKKKSKLNSEFVMENVEYHEKLKELDVGKSSRTESKKDDIKTLEEDATDKERKLSKKRKRVASEENNSQPIDKNEVEELKRRKTIGSEELKGSKQVTEVNGTLGNSNSEKEGEESASQKSAKKQANGSAEPKTIKAFQRVKVDEVVFTDERLKDNSYWAKEGAEIGYGAKAQEVLGQVRGRDFRHEKTKKKRGSYRGGLIDLNSHSIKFNYSDEE